MLFVRTEGISDTMVKVPLLIAGLLVIALMMPLQASFSSARALDLVLYSDGSAHVTAEFDADPLEPSFEVGLFGPSVDNFVAIGEDGPLLYDEPIGDRVTVYTFGSPTVTVEYDIHDLISKKGRNWTFSLDSPTEYSLSMPPNSIIIGMSNSPSNVEILNDQIRMVLDPGLSEIDYIFATTPAAPNPPAVPPNPQPTDDLLIYALVGIGIAAAAAAAVMIKRRQRPAPAMRDESEPISPESIFAQRPEMRDDDMEIVKFISENGGQAMESELRKKFLQPRTTMWRAVKRLERLGIIEITKKDQQNLVVLRKELGEET